MPEGIIKKMRDQKKKEKKRIKAIQLLERNKETAAHAVRQGLPPVFCVPVIDQELQDVHEVVPDLTNVIIHGKSHFEGEIMSCTSTCVSR